MLCIYMVNTNNYIIFFHRIIKCKYMSLNIVMELSVWEGNKHWLLCSVLNLLLFWNLKLFEQYEYPNTCAHKNDFSLSPFNLTLSRRKYSSYRNQSTDLLCKLMSWFLHNMDLRHESVKLRWTFQISFLKYVMKSWCM